MVFKVFKEFWLRILTYKKSTTKFVPFGTYTFAVLSVGLTAWLVPTYGIIGAAGAILVARICSSLVMLFFLLRAMKIGYPISEIYRIATVAFALALVAYLPITGLLLLKVVPAIAVLVGVIIRTRDELTHTLRIFRGRSMPATP